MRWSLHLPVLTPSPPPPPPPPPPPLLEGWPLFAAAALATIAALTLTAFGLRRFRESRRRRERVQAHMRAIFNSLGALLKGRRDAPASFSAEDDEQREASARKARAQLHFHTLMLHLIRSDGHFHHHEETTHEQLLRHPSLLEDSPKLLMRRQSSENLMGGPSPSTAARVCNDPASFCGTWTIARQEGQAAFLEAMQLNWVLRKAAESITPPDISFFLDEVRGGTATM